MAGGQADLTSIPAHVREAFSTRSAQVEQERAELIDRWVIENDGELPDARTVSRLERSAVLASRPAKTHGLPADHLHDQWRTQALALGVDVDDFRSLALANARQRPVVDDWRLVGDALELVAAESSTWLPADIARHLATLLPPAAARDADELVRTIDRLTDHAVSLCIELAPERDGPLRTDGRPVLEHVTDRRLTSEVVLEQEQYLQTWAMGRAYPVEPSPDRQAAAAEAMFGTGSFVLVVGPAGTGKTRATASAVKSLQDQGRPVIGVAPSGKAANVLRLEAGCPTGTLAAFLLREGGPSPTPLSVGTTDVLDEAGMATTQDLVRLAALAERNYWRVIAVGDPDQLPPVGRGGMFAHWCETVPHHELDAPRRFVQTWEAEASLALRRGDRTIAADYQAHGRLHPADPATLPLQIARVHENLSAQDKDIAITTTSRSTALAINQEIQRHTHHHEYESHVPLADGSNAFVGDRIATRRNDRVRSVLATKLADQVRLVQFDYLSEFAPHIDYLDV